MQVLDSVATAELREVIYDAVARLDRDQNYESLRALAAVAAALAGSSVVRREAPAKVRRRGRLLR